MLSSGTVRMRPKEVLQAIYFLTTEEGSMKRYRFLQAVEEALPSLRTMLKGKALTDNEANGIISDVVHGIFTRKAFAKMSQENLIPFLRRTALWELSKRRRESIAHAAKFVQLADPGEADHYVDEVQEDREMSSDECPFCHVGGLNVHGACALCHTVVGKRAEPKVRALHLSDIAGEDDLEMTTDVRRALENLDEEERKVVVAVICGQDTLNDAACYVESRASMWRVYTKGVEKLRMALKEYAAVKNLRGAARRVSHD